MVSETEKRMHARYLWAPCSWVELLWFVWGGWWMARSVVLGTTVDRFKAPPSHSERAILLEIAVEWGRIGRVIESRMRSRAANYGNSADRQVAILRTASPERSSGRGHYVHVYIYKWKTCSVSTVLYFTTARVRDYVGSNASSMMNVIELTRWN